MSEELFSNKKIKLNTWAFIKLFCSTARCIEDLNCNSCKYLCGFFCCLYDCFCCCTKQGLYKYFCCCLRLCCCKDINQIKGYKLRRLYTRTVKKLHGDLDVCKMVTS